MQKILAKIKSKYLVFNASYFSPFVYALIFLFLLGLGIFINFLLIPGDLSLVGKTLKYWNVSATDKVVQEQWYINYFPMVQKSIWQIGASVVAGIGLTIGAMATQALTRNHLADGSTLGLVQGAICGIIFILSYGFTSFLFRYTFAIIGSLLAAGLVFMILVFTKYKKTGNRIILAGLAIGVIFKTLSFIFKVNDKTLSSVNFTYVLGGADAISQNSQVTPQDFLDDSIFWSSILIIGALLILIINIKGMNLLELGEERAKTLGSNIIISRLLVILTVALAIPASVILVGNLAFIGLFSVHIARWFTKSRNYAKVMPASILISMLIASFGLQMTQHFPSVNSGLWMTFIGAPYLIYVGLRGLK